MLILDGDARIRARLAAALDEALAEARGSAPTDVIEASTLPEALACAPIEGIAVIFVDVHVDAQTGVGAVARLRARAPDALIVVLTNEAGEVHRRECIRHGADAFFDKSKEFDHAVELVGRRMTRTS